jgi:hypothetical protein
LAVLATVHQVATAVVQVLQIIMRFLLAQLPRWVEMETRVQRQVAGAVLVAELLAMAVMVFLVAVVVVLTIMVLQILLVEMVVQA